MKKMYWPEAAIYDVYFIEWFFGIGHIFEISDEE